MCVCVCVLTDLVLLQFGDWLQKNTHSNYLERAPGHWESHYIITTPPTHTHTLTHRRGKIERPKEKKKIVEGRSETKKKSQEFKTAKPQSEPFKSLTCLLETRCCKDL